MPPTTQVAGDILHHDIPTDMLSPSEKTALREIYTELNLLCEQLSSMNEAVQERLVASLRRLPSSGLDGTQAPQEPEATYGLCLSNQDSFPIAAICSTDVRGNSGKRGLRFGDPMYYTIVHLTNAQEHIARLIHKEIPRTKTDPALLRSLARLSSGDNTREQTDIPTAPNSRPPQREI